jgi:hypothetical protein
MSLTDSGWSEPAVNPHHQNANDGTVRSPLSNQNSWLGLQRWRFLLQPPPRRRRLGTPIPPTSMVTVPPTVGDTHPIRGTPMTRVMSLIQAMPRVRAMPTSLAMPTALALLMEPPQPTRMSTAHSGFVPTIQQAAPNQRSQQNYRRLLARQPCTDCGAISQSPPRQSTRELVAKNKATT